MQNNELFATNANEKGLQSFNFNDSPIRTLLNENGEVYFVASDVCKVLELSNVGQAISRLDEDEKSNIILNDVAGRPNKSIIINESGLYSLVLSSRKPEAKAFKKWVTSEVLPQIRKTGAYISKPLTPIEMLEMQVQIAKQHEQRLAKLEAKVETINTEFYTLAGYYKLKGKKWNLVDNGIKVGKDLTELSKIEGYAVRQMHSERFGCVNAYHINVLDEYFSVVNKLGKQNGLF
jgi:prophage antirepressor-like protein